MSNPVDLYYAGYYDGITLVLDTIKRAGERHPRPAAKSTLLNLHKILSEGLLQCQAMETENPTSHSSSTVP